MSVENTDPKPDTVWTAAVSSVTSPADEQFECAIQRLDAQDERIAVLIPLLRLVRRTITGRDEDWEPAVSELAQHHPDLAIVAVGLRLQLMGE